MSSGCEACASCKRRWWPLWSARPPHERKRRRGGENEDEDERGADPGGSLDRLRSARLEAGELEAGGLEAGWLQRASSGRKSLASAGQLQWLARQEAEHDEDGLAIHADGLRESSAGTLLPRLMPMASASSTARTRVELMVLSAQNTTSGSRLYLGGVGRDITTVQRSPHPLRDERHGQCRNRWTGCGQRTAGGQPMGNEL